MGAERAVVGACLIDPDTPTRPVTDSLSASDFHDSACATIFDALQQLHKAGKPCDFAVVTDYLDRKGVLESIGGAAVLTELEVLWVESEEAQWLNWDRATAWGLPLDRLRFPFDDPMRGVLPELPEHRRAIEHIARKPAARFVVIDSLSGASTRGENSSQMLTAKWLAALARDTGKAILLLHHLRKPGRSLNHSGCRSPKPA